MEWIKAKSILQKTSYGKEWFGIDYNMNLYKGCSHGCIYCDSRSSCYQIENFDQVRAKENEIVILEKELKSKRKKGVIGIGAMSDTYNPWEEKMLITRKALQLIEQYKFGVSMETKSKLMIRDIDILTKINQQADVILKYTITTTDDELAKKIEPYVSLPNQRLIAMEKLAKAGLFVGTLMTPILPFITDSEENIKQVIRASAKHGAKFVYTMGGVTLRDNQRDYYYEKLDRLFPKMKQKYQATYGNQYFCQPVNQQLRQVIREECEKNHLLYRMEDIVKAYQKDRNEKQISLFDEE